MTIKLHADGDVATPGKPKAFVNGVEVPFVEQLKLMAKVTSTLSLALGEDVANEVFDSFAGVTRPGLSDDEALRQPGRVTPPRFGITEVYTTTQPLPFRITSLTRSFTSCSPSSESTQSSIPPTAHPIRLAHHLRRRSK